MVDFCFTCKVIFTFSMHCDLVLVLLVLLVMLHFDAGGADAALCYTHLVLVGLIPPGAAVQQIHALGGLVV